MLLYNTNKGHKELLWTCKTTFCLISRELIGVYLLHSIAQRLDSLMDASTPIKTIIVGVLYLSKMHIVSIIPIYSYLQHGPRLQYNLYSEL